MCALLVGLPDVTVIGVGDRPGWLRVVVEAPSTRPGCSCGGVVHRHGVREVELVELGGIALRPIPLSVVRGLRPWSEPVFECPVVAGSDRW
jgi:hypothetical protein